MPRRVLIVDDEALRATVAAVLTERRYEIVGEAATVAEARIATARLRPDAVLLDVNLPDGTGITRGVRRPGWRQSLSDIPSRTSERTYRNGWRPQDRRSGCGPGGSDGDAGEHVRDAHGRAHGG